MTEFRSSCGPLPHIPDDLSIPQFFLDHITTPSRPPRPEHVPWFIEDKTGRQIGYLETLQRTNDLATALKHNWNLGDDDVVCLFSPNHVDYPVAMWAIHRNGAIVTPANPGYTVEELVYQLETSSSKAIITHTVCLETAIAAAKKAGIPTSHVIHLTDRWAGLSSHASNVQTVEEYISFGASREIVFEDRKLRAGEARTKVAFLSFSSGTTGKPKAVMIPHFSIIANIFMKVAHSRINEPEARRYSPGDVATAILPFFHIFGLVVNLHYLLFCGLSLVVMPKFDFAQFLKSITRHNISCLFVVPPQVVLLCKHPLAKKHDLSQIRYVLSGAAPLSPEVTLQLASVLPNASIGQGFGLTETGPTIAMCPPSQKIGTLGSCGQLIAGLRARIVKADGKLAAEGEPGELVITSPAVPLGYLNNPQATKETFVDGWVRTGDEVIMKNGDLFIVDRIKEIIKVKGFQVAPAEIEGHILNHPSVADCCVVGVSDEYSGELPMAFVVLKQEYAQMAASNPSTAEAMKVAIMKHVSDHKVPYKRLTGGVQLVPSIPKNPSGKLLRRVLRDQANRERAERAKVRAHL